jgi:hypothetical protein
VALESKQRDQAIDADIDDYRQQNGKEESVREKRAEKDGPRSSLLQTTSNHSELRFLG